jgi:hypothetical protein
MHAACIVERIMRATLVAALLVLPAAACGGSTTTSGDLFAQGGDDAAADGTSGADGGTSGDDAGGPGRDGGPSADAGASDAAALDCFLPDGGVRPEWKACTSAQACTEKLHQLNCCGSELAVGLNHAFVNAFGKCEAAWDAKFPGCGCAAAPTMTENGDTLGQGGTIVVECVDIRSNGVGVCRTRIQN